MNKKNLSKYILSFFSIFFFLIIAIGSGDTDDNSSEERNNTSQLPSSENDRQPSKSYQKKSINGVYSYSDNSAKSTVTVSGSRWSGKLTIISGFGDAYDRSNASYSNGIVKDGVLYDDSGYFELGSVDGTSLTIQISSSMVTHYK
jgi:hypothetical protein